MDKVEEFISHYGKKGMRWGIRNRRSSVSKGRPNRTTFKKTPSRLSDEELTKRLRRLELERKYNDLNAPIKSKGKEYTHSLLENSGRTVVGAIVGGAAGFLVQKVLREKFG